MSQAGAASRERHIEFLHERIFQTRTKWPHFARMLGDVRELAETCREGARVAILERAYVYGGDSLFAPLFDRQKVTVVDCEISTTAERDGYQKSWTDDPRCLHRPADRRAPITKTGLPDASADLLLVPNVVHHVRDQDGMFEEIRRLMAPGATGYLFEALLRELHQAPDDYLRYTPWGFEAVLERHGLRLAEWRPAGGPFESIAYCWVQALQYFPEPERRRREEWFFGTHFPELLELDRRHPRNLVRPHTTFPVGYSVFFKKDPER